MSHREKYNVVIHYFHASGRLSVWRYNARSLIIKISAFFLVLLAGIVLIFYAYQKGWTPEFLFHKISHNISYIFAPSLSDSLSHNKKNQSDKGLKKEGDELIIPLDTQDKNISTQESTGDDLHGPLKD